MLLCIILIHVFSYTLAQSRVKFILYTSPTSKHSLTNTDFENIANGYPFKFLVHGWGETADTIYYKTITDAYFKRGIYNVVQVDWSALAFSEYFIAVRNTVQVGQIIGTLITHLHQHSSINLNTTHILGHSLGAHVAGVTGATVYNLTGQKIDRITGLDPAGPLFDRLIVTGRQLNKNDANLVDIVNTDSGLFGSVGSLGKINFYPNGGKALQPGCTVPVTFEDVLEVLSRIRVDPVSLVFCSHRKSTEYFMRSINTNIYAVKCSSWKNFKENKCVNNEVIPFGEDVSSSGSGNYYLWLGK